MTRWRTGASRRAHDNLSSVEPAAVPDRDTARDAKHADERERLYRAGWVVLRRNGYANAGITDILGEAKLGTRAFYRHFDSKDELLVAMFSENAAATASRLAERVDTAGTALDRLHAWIDEILALGDDPRHSEAARMFISPTMPGVFDEAGNEAIATCALPPRRAGRWCRVWRVPRLRSGRRRGDDPRDRVAAVHRRDPRSSDDESRRRSLPRRTVRVTRPRRRRNDRRCP